MCRTGGRRCPSSRHTTTEAERARKSAYRARAALHAAEGAGDGTRAATARQRLTQAEADLAAARGRQHHRDQQTVGADALPQATGDTPEQRFRSLREAGWSGPIDQDGYATRMEDFFARHEQAKHAEHERLRTGRAPG